MKKLITTLVILLTFTVHSQKLDFDQYVNFISKDVFFVQDLLLSKNWELYSFDKEERTMSFIYKHKDIIQEMVTFYCYNNNKVYAIRSMIHSTRKYNEYMRRIRALNFVLNKQVVNDDGSVMEDYKNIEIDTLLRITTYQNENNITFHDFYLIE